MAEQDQLYLMRRAPRDMSRLRRYEGITRYEALAKIEIGQKIAEDEEIAQAESSIQPHYWLILLLMSGSLRLKGIKFVQ